MTYRFGDFVLDTGSRTLFCNNERCFLEPLAFDVLTHLCENPQTTITTEALYAKHWPNVVVTPNSLTRVIAQIRKTLGDDHRNPRFIETVPKVGYRFVGNIKQTQSFPGTKLHRWKVYSALVGVIIVCVAALLISLYSPGNNKHPITLVVFPFESAEEIGFIDSFSQELIEQFYVVPELQLRSFLAAKQAQEDTGDLLSAAVSLGATHYISGRVEKSDTSSGLTFYTELIKTDTGQVVWSQRVSKPFDLQAAWPAETKSQVLDALLGLPVHHLSTRSLYQPHPEAYRLYLKAKYIWLQRGKQPMDDAVYLLKEAVSIDPEFASAWDSLSAALASWGTYGDVPESVLDDAAAAARRAIELDPGVSYSYYLLYMEALGAYRYQEALTHIQKMKNNAPGNAMAVYWYATSLRELGRMKEAHENLLLAVELDPTIWVMQGDFAITVMHTADVELAYQKMTDLWDKGLRALWLWRGIFQAKLLRGERASLRSWMGEVNLTDAQQALLELELTYFDTHHVDRNKVASFLNREDLSEVDHRTIIFSLHYLQQADLLFEYLETLIRDDRMLAVYALAVLSTDYVNDPRMKALFNQIGLLEYWQDAAVTDICRHTDGGWQCSQFRRVLTQRDMRLLSS